MYAKKSSTNTECATSSVPYIHIRIHSHIHTHYTPEVLNLAVAEIPAGHDVELPNDAAGDVPRLQL